MAWELLRTNYKDAVWSGNRKFRLVNNPDSTVSLTDVTQYRVIQDAFMNARDTNRTNEAINALLAALDQNTNLYAYFANFFNEQKTAFQTKENEVRSELAAMGDDAKEDLQNRVDAIAADLFNRVAVALAALQAKADSDLEGMKDTYEYILDLFMGNKGSEFATWFDAIKGQLDTDAAGRLQNEVNEQEDRLLSLERMVIQNDIIAPINMNNGSGTPVLLVDDTGSAIVANWKYEYHE